MMMKIIMNQLIAVNDTYVLNPRRKRINAYENCASSRRGCGQKVGFPKGSERS